MSDKKEQTKTDATELNDEELEKAQGGCYQKITFEGVKAEPTPDPATLERK